LKTAAEGPPDDVPEKVLRFLNNYIDSIEQIHVLILLYENKEKEWTIEAINQELRSAEPSIEKRLTDLINSKVLAPPKTPGRFTYQPYSDELRSAISDVVEFYKVRPYKVIELIFSQDSKDVIRTFANAFRFKKEK
jgi:hypothetical protein